LVDLEWFGIQIDLNKVELQTGSQDSENIFK